MTIRIRQLTLVGVSIVTAITIFGCDPDPATHDPRGDTPRAVMTRTMAVRTDRAPISDRFAALGDFVNVHWQATLVGDPDIPGPNDTLIRALVQLASKDFSTAAAAYQWNPAPTGWQHEMPDGLRPYTPAKARWVTNPQYSGTISGDRYAGSVYLDLNSGLVYLDLSQI